MTDVVLVDGLPAESVPVLDRGLQYGDGLFETLAIRAGVPRLLGHHLERLAEGCRRLGIPTPDPAMLRREIETAAPAADAVVKIILTRGVAARGYRPPTNPQPTRIVAGFTQAPRRASDADGIHVRMCATRLGRNPALAGIKHLCRLEQVLARAEWTDEGVAEGLMQDDRGRLVCATQSNLFVLRKGQLATPAVDECGVAGVMRRALVEWAGARGLPVAVCPVMPEDLEEAEEVLLTNALTGARPVIGLAGRKLATTGLALEFNAWLERL